MIRARRAPLAFPLLLGAGVGIAVGLAVGLALARSSAGVQSLDRGRFRSPTGTEIELLLSESDLGGGELQVGEITFPAGYRSGEHRHGATEVFYVLEGELGHVVDGVSQTLGPGDLGFVRPPSTVDHVTAADGPPVRALVIWAPGGEGTRIVESWERLEGEPPGAGPDRGR